jgi:predicted Rossmann fold flavoprotein
VRRFDVVIAGAGAAGMMAAIEAGKRGRSVLVFDHAAAPGEKIRISGGGRCNFTNTGTRPDRFISANKRFAISALARYTPAHFIKLVDSYGIAYHEKALGQLFCDGSSQQIINLLTSEMGKAGVVLELSTSLESVEKTDGGFVVRLSSGDVACSVVGCRHGRQVDPQDGRDRAGLPACRAVRPRGHRNAPGAGAADVRARHPVAARAARRDQRRCHATAGGKSFREALLFTHRGLSGPAILQISSYWREGQAITVDFAGHGCVRGVPKPRAKRRRNWPCRPCCRRFSPSGWPRCWPRRSPCRAWSATFRTPRSPSWPLR